MQTPLSHPFALHLKNLIFRAKTGRSTKNPMTQAIKNNSPIVFDIAIYIALDLMDRYHFMVNEDETAFLAIHIGAEIERQSANIYKIPAILICPDYHDMASGILNTMMMNFGNQLNLIGSVTDETQCREKLREQRNCNRVLDNSANTARILRKFGSFNNSAIASSALGVRLP